MLVEGGDKIKASIISSNKTSKGILLEASNSINREEAWGISSRDSR
jgi:hypothetical protein